MIRKYYYSHNHCGNAKHKKQNKRAKEPLELMHVPNSDALPGPRAMMVVTPYANIAIEAVHRISLHKCQASLALA